MDTPICEVQLAKASHLYYRKGAHTYPAATVLEGKVKQRELCRKIYEFVLPKSVWS